jgi:hypothetical protein
VLACTAAALIMTGCSSDPAATPKAACADIVALNASLNAISNDLRDGKQLFATFQHQADALVGHAPASLRADARALQAAITAAKRIVDRTTSMTQLQRLEQSDPQVQAAVSDMVTSVQPVTEWRTGHCA